MANVAAIIMIIIGILLFITGLILIGVGTAKVITGMIFGGVGALMLGAIIIAIGSAFL